MPTRAHGDEWVRGSDGRQGTALSSLMNDPSVIRLMGWVVSGAVAVLVVTLFGIVALRAVVPLADPDTWWHLVMGHKYLDGTSIRHPGPMSYFGTRDWYSRDWLTQIVAAKGDSWFGLPGVAWLYGLGLVALVVTLYRASRARASFTAASIATTVGLVGAMSSLTARPQLVSFVLLAVTIGALLRTSEDLAPRWWLAVLTGVWACVHGMWFLCPALQLVMLVALAMDRRLDLRAAKKLALLLACSLLAVGLTPNGLRLLRNPMGTILGVAPYISEYQPPSVKSLFYVMTLFMIGFVALTWARRGSANWVQIALLATAAAFAVQTSRTITVGAVIVTPLFAEAIESWISPLTIPFPRKLERVLVYGGALSALVVTAFVVPHTAAHPSNRFPTGLDARLEEIPKSAVVLNQLADGGYLVWRHPGMRVVVDGLADQYSTTWEVDALEALNLGRGWQDFVRRSGARYALLDTDSGLATALRLTGWMSIDAGGGRVLLKAPTNPSS